MARTFTETFGDDLSATYTNPWFGSGNSLQVAPGTPPTRAGAKALRMITVAGTNTSIYTAGTLPKIPAGTTFDVNVSIYVSANAMASFDATDLMVFGATSDGTQAAAKIRWHMNGATLGIRAEAGASVSTDIPISLNAWHTITLHVDAVLANSYIQLDGGTTQAFTAQSKDTVFINIGSLAGNTDAMTYYLGDITIDSTVAGTATAPYIYVDFENGANSNALSATNLGNATHGGNGSWSSGGTTPGAMTISTAQEHDLSTRKVTVAGTDYLDTTGTRSAKFDLPAATSGYWGYFWKNTPDIKNVSSGVWIYTNLATTDTGTFANAGGFSNGLGSDSVGLMINSGQMYLESFANPNGNPDVGSKYNYTVNTWYWVTMQYQQYVDGSQKHQLNIYDANFNLLSHQEKAARSVSPSQATFYSIGRLGDNNDAAIAAGAGLWYDDLILDYVSGTFPLLPTSTSTASVVNVFPVVETDTRGYAVSGGQFVAAPLACVKTDAVGRSIGTSTYLRAPYRVVSTDANGFVGGNFYGAPTPVVFTDDAGFVSGAFYKAPIPVYLP